MTCGTVIGAARRTGLTTLSFTWHPQSSYGSISSARHSGTQAAFNEFLVKPGKLEPEFGQIYSRARKVRKEQDYDLQAASLTHEDAARIVADAERCLSRLERYLQEAGAIG